VSEAQSIIPSLYLPVSKQQLLLPNVSVAEVVGYQQPINKLPEMPNYFLGLIKWRGVDIPVISYEFANEQIPDKLTKNSRIVVINTIGEHQASIPFFAIVTQGIPRLVKVSDGLIKTLNNKIGKADSVLVKVDGEEAIIPNIEFLESLVYKNR